MNPYQLAAKRAEIAASSANALTYDALLVAGGPFIAAGLVAHLAAADAHREAAVAVGRLAGIAGSTRRPRAKSGAQMAHAAHTTAAQLHQRLADLS